MSSYLPPTDNLPKFNPHVFQSSFTDEEVETKVKNLETKTQFNTINSTDGDKLNIDLGSNGTFKVVPKSNKSQGFFITEVKSGTDCSMYVGDGCDDLITTRDADTFIEQNSLLVLRQNGVTDGGQGRPLLVMKFNPASTTNNFDWDKRYVFSQNGNDLLLGYDDGSNSATGTYQSGATPVVKFLGQTKGIEVNGKYPLYTSLGATSFIQSKRETTSGVTGTFSFDTAFSAVPTVTATADISPANALNGDVYIISLNNISATQFSYTSLKIDGASKAITSTAPLAITYTAIGQLSAL